MIIGCPCGSSNKICHFPDDVIATENNFHENPRKILFRNMSELNIYILGQNTR